MKIYGLAVLAILMFFAGTTYGASTCTFTNSGKSMVMQGDCDTDVTIMIPDGKTVDGNGFTVTAKDPAGGHFLGAVFKNAGSSASVTNITITTANLANVCDPSSPIDTRLRGVWLEGASGSVTSSRIIGINQGTSGCQEGNAIDVRNLGSPETVRVTIDGNTITGYQKTGIVVNGNVNATVTDNLVDGGPPVGYIARNGIQFGYGASGMIKKNTVNGNSYTGASAVSGGILVVGGPGYSVAFPDFCVGIQIIQNTITENDIGVFISQYETGFSGPPNSATNLKVINNVISKAGPSNGYAGGYQAGVSDVGNNDKVINNSISGAGYAPGAGAYTVELDIDPLYALKAKVHAND